MPKIDKKWLKSLPRRREVEDSGDQKGVDTMHLPAAHPAVQDEGLHKELDTPNPLKTSQNLTQNQCIPMPSVNIPRG